MSHALKRYYGPVRRPAGSVRLPVWSVIRTGCSRPPQAGAGEGLPSSRVHRLPIPIPLPRGVPRRLLLQVFGAFRGLRRDFSGSALPCPLAGLASRGCRIRLDATGWAVASPRGAFDAGLRRRAFPPDAASLLPGLLAATRTGLSPAGRHEFVTWFTSAAPPPFGTGSCPRLLGTRIRD